MGVKPGVKLVIIYLFFYKSDIKMLNLGYRSYRWVGRCDSDIFYVSPKFTFLGGTQGSNQGVTMGNILSIFQKFTDKKFISGLQVIQLSGKM